MAFAVKEMDMVRRVALVHGIGSLLLMTIASAAEAAQSSDVRQMLEAFVDDYRADPMAMSADFGIKVGADWWSVSVRRHQQAIPEGRLTSHRSGPHDVTLRDGPPSRPTWYFDLADRSVLEEIFKGELNAGTAGLQSFGSDKVKVEIREMEGFRDKTRGEADMYHALSHFWTRGTPEITYFGRNQSLPTHGVGAVSLYTMKGNRIAWFSMMKDEAANSDPALEAGQVPNLFIVTKGRGKAKLADKEFDLHEGMSVFVAPYVRHVLWNPYDEPMEGVFILFGDNTDAAFGKSYIDVKEGLHDYYGSLPSPPQ